MTPHGPSTILVVADADDRHAAALAATVREQHGLTAIRLDPREFPSRTGSFRVDPSGTARSLSRIVGLDDVRSVWWRRTTGHTVPHAGGAEAQSESDGFLQGLLWSIPAYWVNDPGADRTASRRIVQLETARRAGFAIPETLITNDPDEARSFVGGRPGAVVRKRGNAGGRARTRLCTDADLGDIEAIRNTPTAFQDYIAAECDLRVVWVDGVEWAVRVAPGHGERGAPPAHLRPERLPASVGKSLTTLMGALGLSFGVLDLRIGLDGEYYFLEVDPQGRFAHLATRAELPIFRSLANLLVLGDGAVADL
ncbi:hypothetical protein AB0H71_00545 [Nocardia sp. NPDC050697]|uniref:hypothetical protein n=1 Tax=Nocardia sp. NPDC050697 TaxID=3155158 RepID=UPI0033FFBD75